MARPLKRMLGRFALKVTSMPRQRDAFLFPELRHVRPLASR
jgi:hypothetical protein